MLSTVFLSAQNAPKLAEAETLIRRGQLDDGIAAVRQFLTKTPQSAEAHNLLGIALTGKGDLAGAIKEYRTALRIRPDFIPALKNLAINELSRNDTAEAQRHFAAALKFSPRDPVIHAYLGKIAYARQDYSRAVSHFAEAGELQKDPTVASVLIDSELRLGDAEKAKAVLDQLELSNITPQWQFRIGLALAQHGLYQEAIPYFQAVNAGNPDAYEAAFNLAICQMERKQFPEAADVLAGIARHGHNTAELNILLAEAYEGGGHTQQAVDALREAARLAPQNEDIYVNLTALCTKYESYDLGLEIVQAGLHYHPQSDRLILQRGVIYAMRSQFDLAEQDFQRVSQLAPENSLGDAALGVSYMQAGDYPKAIETLRQRIRERPNDSILHFFLGQALVRSGAAPGDRAFSEAKAAMEKSVQLNPNNADARVDLAKLYVKESRWNEALQQLDRARSLDSKNKAVYSTLAIVYRHSQRPELATAMLGILNQLNEDDRKAQPVQRRLRIAGDQPSFVSATP